MDIDSRRMLQTLNEKAYSAARGVGRLIPIDAKRFFFRLRPAAVTWDLRDHGLVFVQIPKVATTSMRAALGAFVAGESHVDPDEVERRDVLVTERYQLNAYPAEIRKVSRERFSFAFVRNPLDRLYSAFVNKVADPVDGSVNLFDRHEISLDMSFPDFVRAVTKLPDDRCDLHLRSQYRFITDRAGFVVEFIGRFEQLEADWAMLMQRFGVPAMPQRNVSSHRPYSEAYTPDLARLVANRYRRDIELFGYAEEVGRLT
jgi:dermatan 4-sulfotransferase 1